MNIIEVNAKQIDIRSYKERYAREDDASRLINDDTLLVENGLPILLYKKIDWCDTNDLLQACKNVKYITDTRLPRNGLKPIKTRSTIFGYKPRIPLRQDFCSAASMAMDNPIQHGILTNFAAKLSDIYKQYFPDTYKLHEDKLQSVKDIWRIPGSVFTSGIINKDNPLMYHHDTGNFKNVLSNMVAFKHGVIGGRLVMPEYDIKLEIENNTLSIFDGQQILHGVTPIKKYKPDAHRYTIVYYSLEKMWKCETIKDEVNRIRKLKKEREKKRI